MLFLLLKTSYKKYMKKGIIVGMIVGILMTVGIMLGIQFFTSDDSDSDKKNKKETREEIDEEEFDRGKPSREQEESEPASEVTEEVVSITGEVLENVTETEPEVPAADPVTDKAKRTIMIYMVGSDLETNGGAATNDIIEMLDAQWDSDVNVVLQTGGTKDWHNKVMTDGKMERFYMTSDGQLELLESLGARSMVKPGNLTEFIRFAADNYPAENYALVLWDHGGGVPISFGKDELYPGKSLADYQIGQAIAASDVHFEALIFDACLMCSLEMCMAIKDNVDFVVAAESVVNGIGIYYTNWMNLAGSSENLDAQKYCEIIVRDYMNSLKAVKKTGSMSVIRMDNIDDVYAAYIEYLKEVNADIKGGNIAEYIRLRDECGYYSNTDCVDLITLATKYNNDKSTNLINAVVSTVVYTDSDIAYGHGITAYSPYEYPENYPLGRKSFEELGYDKSITDFYDAFCSVELAVLDDVDESLYDEAWFDWDFVEQLFAEAQESQPINMDVVDMGGYGAILLSDEDWNIISDIQMSVLLYDDDIAVLMGQDSQYILDDNDNLMVVNPDYWLCSSDGTYTNNYCLEYYEDGETGEWAKYYAVTALVNGQDAYLYVCVDGNYKEDILNKGSVQFYVLTAFEGEDPYDDTPLELKDDDEVDLVMTVMDLETSELFYIPYETPVKGSELEFEFCLFDGEDVSTAVYYAITDIYGNEYSSEFEDPADYR